MNDVDQWRIVGGLAGLDMAWGWIRTRKGPRSQAPEP